MGSHEHHPVPVDPASLQQAQNMWAGFTAFTKYGVIAIVIVLLGMAVFLV